MQIERNIIYTLGYVFVIILKLYLAPNFLTKDSRLWNILFLIYCGLNDDDIAENRRARGCTVHSAHAKAAQLQYSTVHTEQQ